MKRKRFGLVILHLEQSLCTYYNVITCNLIREYQIVFAPSVKYIIFSKSYLSRWDSIILIEVVIKISHLER